MDSNSAFMRSNNLIMHSHLKDEDKICKLMKILRRESSNTLTNKLITPSRTYFGTDVLERFAADAELLGKFLWREL